MKQQVLSIVLISMALTVFVGCSQPSLESLISSAQKQGFETFKEDALKQFGDYEWGRKYKHFQEAFDSLIPIIVKKPKDTIFVFEWCNPPDFFDSYGVNIWNSARQYYHLKNQHFVEIPIAYISETDKKLDQIIERWNKREIYEKSNARPFVCDANWLMESNMVTRLIFENGKCIQAESIFFREIDLDCKAPVTIIE